ncbi:MAG TPA: DNA translocase FtsK [Caldilineae bacterium]|jgi:S-DNA-T family DNA segregation ATPase FtsK/SpoIIIE|nr:DNA translocase FtsK [Caldilineae bacterium]
MAEYYTGAPATRNDGQGEAHFTAALLQATLTARKVTAMVSLAWDGPQVWAFSVSLGLGEDPEKVERLSGALAIAAGAESCRVARDRGRLLIEIPKPPEQRRPLRAGRLDVLDPPAPMAVALGIATGGRVVWLDLADERTCHVIIGGTTGSGKTMALHWLLYRLLRQNSARDLRLLALDPKRGELDMFAHVPHLLHRVVTHPVEAARVLAWLTTELDRRAESGRHTPRLMVVIEEVADLLAVNRDLAAPIARVAQIGRGLGVHLVVTTQQPGAKSLGDAVANFPARLLGRVASATLTYGAAGRAKTMADQLLGRGDFLLLTAGTVTRLQVPLMSGREYGRLPRVEQVATLEDELPNLVAWADRWRDPRGGRGARVLGDEDYERMERELREGAGVEDLRAEFGIGYNRARRIRSVWREVQG